MTWVQLSGWITLTLLNAIGLVILARMLWRLTSMNERTLRHLDDLERQAFHTNPLRITHAEVRIQQLEDARAEVDVSEIWPQGQNIDLDELLRGLTHPRPPFTPREAPKPEPEAPRKPAPTSFARILKDDTEDPV